MNSISSTTSSVLRRLNNFRLKHYRHHCQLLHQAVCRIDGSRLLQRRLAPLQTISDLEVACFHKGPSYSYSLCGHDRASRSATPTSPDLLQKYFFQDSPRLHHDVTSSRMFWNSASNRPGTFAINFESRRNLVTLSSSSSLLLSSASPTSSSSFSSSSHNFSTHSNQTNIDINVKDSSDTTVELSEADSSVVLHSGGKRRRLPLMWLRDHCRCATCYNPDTSQKQTVINPFHHDFSVSRLVVERGDVDTDMVIAVYWKDGHVSKYSVDWLLTNSYSEERQRAIVERTLWDGEVIRNGGPSAVSFKSHMESDEGLRQTFRNLLEFGFSFIKEAPVSLEGTQQAVERVGPIQETLYGGMWSFTANGSRSDTAYSATDLGAHTDNTYLEIPAGIQVFQCLGHDGSGGDTLLVDGFHAVETLRQTHPQAVRCLSSHLVPHEYKEPSEEGCSPGYHLYTLCPVIQLHPATGEIMHLRFNQYDRAPLNTIPPDQMAEFYRSYHLLSTTISDPRGQYWVKLTPGNIVLIDNWRVMHGRSSFDGQRMMCGCYLRRDDWVSKARVLGLLV